ncbi:MAG: YfhO family protein, partial [Planctomycetaceae bacterium]|nr:YfhO family protein [Planctomycetaceae bacterium]
GKQGVARNGTQRRASDAAPPASQASPAINLLLVLGMLLTVGELWLVSRLVTYSPLVDAPPLAELKHSFIRQELAEFGAGARLSAPYMNLPAVFGAGTANPYFTFGPAEYADPKLRMPGKEQYPELSAEALERKQTAWLRRAGVTHLLSLERLDETTRPVQLVKEGIDPVFNPALGRYRQPVYLYRLDGGRERISAVGAGATGTSLVHLLEDSPERIVANVTADTAQKIVLTELNYPGWQVEIDGKPATMELADGMFQAVEVPAGEHRVVFYYRPISVRVGIWISLGTFLVLALIAHLRFWHPQLLTGRRKEAIGSDESRPSSD